MWTTLLRLPRRRSPVVAPPLAPEANEDDASDSDIRTGCGWFDSSHDLNQGLSVRELAEPASLARELPLPAWIDWQLAACTATHSAARP